MAFGSTVDSAGPTRRRSTSNFQAFWKPVQHRRIFLGVNIQRWHLLTNPALLASRTHTLRAPASPHTGLGLGAAKALR